MNVRVGLALIFVFGLFSAFAGGGVTAANAWYRGEVERVALYSSDGSFIMTMKNDALDDCMHKYAYFKVSVLGTDRVQKAYTMALMSLSTGMQMGVVIDKAINGPGGICEATGMTADLRD